MGANQQAQRSQVRTFKGTTVFDWDVEPSDERPSEFVESSLHMGLNTSCRPSGFAQLPPEVLRPRPPPKRGGGNPWLLALAVVAGVAGAGLYGLIHFFHG